MADINVVNCNMKITRRGGWSWGEHPCLIAQRASQLLPELILQRIVDRFGEESVVEILEPVVVRLRLSMSELHHLDSNTFATVDSSISLQIDEALRRSSLEQQFAASFDRASSEFRQSHPLVDSMNASSEAAAISTAILNSINIVAKEDSFGPSNWLLDLFEWLVEYADAQRLPFLFSQLTSETIAAWHDAIFDAESSYADAFEPITNFGGSPKNDLTIRGNERGYDLGTSPSSGSKALEDRIPASLITLFDQLRVSLPTQLDQRGVHSYRLHAALLAYREGKHHIFDRCVQEAIIRRIKLNESTREIEESHSVEVKSANSHTASSDFNLNRSRFHTQSLISTASVRPGSSNSKFNSEFNIDSVLPFLLIEPLSRAGYWRTLSLALHTAGLHEFVSSFATAFAFKLMNAPLRGWIRTTQQLQAAQAFAAVQDLATHEVDRLANDAERFTSILDAHLASKLLANIPSHHPFLLTKLSESPTDSLLLVDTLGAFPIAIVQHPNELERILQSLDSPCVLLGQCCSDAGLLRELDTLGMSFVLQTMTAETQSLRRVRHRDGRTFWTNSVAANDGQVLKWGARIETCEELGQLFLKEVAIGRQGTIANGDRNLEHSLTLAIGGGLAQIAWDLWRESEDTHPLLTLERFGDLSGKVRITSDEVYVTLPLGRRAMDLELSGILDDQFQLPWLDGRVLRFERG